MGPIGRTAVALVAATLLSRSANAREDGSSASSPACSAAEHRQFDFWVGNWEVRAESGRVAGTNRITSILGGCALQESWTGRSGMVGTSLNVYDPADRQWHQTWVDSSGLRLALAGQYNEGRMVLSGQRPSSETPGRSVRHRITWSRLGEGRVRQLWETSKDEGASWAVVFDGTYVPVSKSPAKPSRVAPSIGVRNGHMLAYDPDRGRVVLFGGADERRVLGDLWEWNGKDWRILAAEGPPPRVFPALAYDRARKRLVLFGGNRVLFGAAGDGDTFLQDLWEWYAGSWHRVTMPMPPARAEAAMIYDSTRRRLVLFGGYRGSGPGRERFGDTWEFGGSSWKRMATTKAPSPRNGAAMAFAVDRRRAVLFGGSGGPSAETWEWDGSAWSLVEAPTAGRYNSAMTYDTRLREVFRFGGWNGKEREGDSWRYDGRRWEQVSREGPSPRNHASIAFDERRGTVVLFGGHDGERVFGDTWEWRAGTWKRISVEAPRPRIDNGH